MFFLKRNFLFNYYFNIRQKYLKPLKSPENAGIVDVQTVEEIFLMVPTILNVHKHFLDELKRRLDSWDHLQMVGDAFIETVRYRIAQQSSMRINIFMFYTLVFKVHSVRCVHDIR